MILLLALIFSRPVYAAEGKAPVAPFNVEADVSVETFDWKHQTNSIFSTGSKMLFSYSNDIWQIELNYTKFEDLRDPSGGTPLGTILNCKRIPDGIRYYHIFPPKTSTNTTTDGKSLNVAIAEPILFPPPEDLELFASWLSFCPNPELPVYDSQHIQRFINLVLLNNPKNKGRYVADYLKPEKCFLSGLAISNDGTDWYYEGGIHQAAKFDPPFERGFKEFEYKVIETTNHNGITFPLKSALSIYFPKPNAKSNQDVFSFKIVRVTTRRIWDDGLDTSSIPAQLFAQDRRPKNLKNDAVAGYVVKNDQWPVASNPDLKVIAQLYSDAEKLAVHESDDKRIFVRIALLAVIIAPIVFYLVFLIRRKQQQK